MATPEVPGLPGPLHWINDPATYENRPDGVAITAGPRCDWFRDPASETVEDGAPALVADVTGDFSLSALVTVDFAGTFDAGVLAIRLDESRWAKLCFEFSPQGQPMVVSVVTRGRSDDANSFPVSGASVWLRASRTGRSFAFHASLDGRSWQFVRHFSLDHHSVDGPDPAPATVAVGLMAQSPTGDGATATFSAVRFAPVGLGDLRDGT